jgi:conjugal transfer pilus assembly protein TrbC
MKRTLFMLLVLSWLPVAGRAGVADDTWLKQQEALIPQLHAHPDTAMGAWATRQVAENPLKPRDRQFIDDLARKQRAAMGEKPATGALYFVSFSVPETGLKRMLREARVYHIPALLRGLVDNSMPVTVQAVRTLVEGGATDGVQIDPPSFARYGITAVPALVVRCEHGFDVVRGNLQLKQALEKVRDGGDCRDVAQSLLAGTFPANLSGKQP